MERFRKPGMPFDTTTLIRVLTAICLFGLLFAIGLRLTAAEVAQALRRCRLIPILLLNFLAVPALVLVVTRLFALDTDFTVGMLLLGAAPFAPVVPIFTKMARADLPLAAGLTSTVPLVSAFVTPLICLAAFHLMPDVGQLEFRLWTTLLILMATVTLPLGLGVLVNHSAPHVARRILRPCEILSEATGFLSLTVISATEFREIISTGLPKLAAIVICSEASLLLGYLVGGADRSARRVIALGTSNRNIALALLLAVGSFAGTPVVPAVVTNGLLLILLGLIHVAFWRFVQGTNAASSP